VPGKGLRILTGESPGNASAEPPKSMTSKKQKQKTERPPREKQKLSYKETRELEALPQTIEALDEAYHR